MLKRHLLYAFGVALWLLPFGIIAQNAPVFEAIAEPRDIAAGGRFELSFRLRNAEGVNFRRPSIPSGLRLASGPSTEQSMGFVNGRMFSQTSWRFEVEAQKAGTYTIGAATVTVNGQTLSSAPLTIKVREARPSAGSAAVGARNGDQVFVVADLEPKTLYVGQQTTWRVRIYTLVGLEAVDLIELPDFKGFYAKEKRRFDTRLEYENLGGKRYATKILYEQALFPQEAGDLSVGIAKIRVGVEAPGPAGGFWGVEQKMLETQPIAIKVSPLPTPPVGFSGGVGNYEATWQADKDTLSTDDALTLRLSLRGNGDARRFAPPKLTVPAGWEAFDPKVLSEEEYDNGEEIKHEQTLEYALVPKEPGQYTFAPQLSYFLADSGKYVPLGQAPVLNVRVGKGKNYQMPPLQSDDLANPSTNDGGKAWRRLKDWARTPWFWGLLCLPLFWLLWRSRRKAAVQPEILPTPKPSPPPIPAPAAQEPVRPRVANPYAGVRALLGSEVSDKTFCDALLKAQGQWLEAELGLTTAAFAPATIEMALAQKGVPTERRNDFVAAWQLCEAVVFGGVPLALSKSELLSKAEIL